MLDASILDVEFDVTLDGESQVVISMGWFSRDAKLLPFDIFVIQFQVGSVISVNHPSVSSADTSRIAFPVDWRVYIDVDRPVFAEALVSLDVRLVP